MKNSTKQIYHKNQKSQLIYVILALLFGPFGLHNFYAQRWGRGLIQLAITLFTGFVGTVITSLWSVINIFTINSDGNGKAFYTNTPAKYICGFLGLIKYFAEIVFWGALIIGFMMGNFSDIGEKSNGKNWTIREKTEKIVTPEKTIYQTTETIKSN
ncbi:MAG: TM2 domain-containing protein [Alphaproteobacteria bacterium]|nr:TM2 domain-containing protein [Alphaproteobacteria bacterium]